MLFSRQPKTGQHFAKLVTEWNNPTIRTMSAPAREMVAALLAEAVNKDHPLPKPSPASQQIADTMSSDGYALLGQVIDAQKAAETFRYFENRPCLNTHVSQASYGDSIRRHPAEAAKDFNFGCYKTDEILAAPHVLEAVTSPLVLESVAAFLGARPMLFSLNTYWTFPRESSPSYGQVFHRDMSHPKFCVLFLYLTDTDEQSGAHQYIRHTQHPTALAPHVEQVADYFDLANDGAGFDSLYETNLAPLIDTINGPAGSAFLSNAYGLHRGLNPVSKPRLMVWARYSVFTEPPDVEKFPRRLLGNRYPKDTLAQHALRGILTG